MSKKITIPKCRNPFVVILNGIRYEYRSGEEVEVPEEVAEVIEFHEESKPKALPTPPDGSTYDEGYAEGYEAGIEAGKAQGGGLYDTEINNLLAVAPFLKKIPYFETSGYSGVFVRNVEAVNTLVVILPFIEEIEECGLDGLGDVYYVVFTSKTPPMVGWMGWWSSEGGGTPPGAIFVPDESVDAYKTTTNLAEFANIIKPLSEYNGEGYEREL